MYTNPIILTISLVTRFWKYVDTTGGLLACWIWIGQRDRKGYGRIADTGRPPRPLLAPRVSYTIHFGPIPDGMCVLHRCDNPVCVNPAHLWVGGPPDNVHDMMSKGRKAPMPKGEEWLDRYKGRPSKGEEHYLAKLTENDVRYIREQVATGASAQLALSKQFNVTHGAIWGIVHRKNWKHVD